MRLFQVYGLSLLFAFSLIPPLSRADDSAPKENEVKKKIVGKWIICVKDGEFKTAVILTLSDKGVGVITAFCAEDKTERVGTQLVTGLSYDVKSVGQKWILSIRDSPGLPDKKADIEFVIADKGLELKSGRVFRTQEDKDGIDMKTIWIRLPENSYYGGTVPETGFTAFFPMITFAPNFLIPWEKIEPRPKAGQPKR